MPLNRLALIRYRTIDDCLCNRARRWTLEDLMDACSDALYEYEGIDRPLSKRTIQYDLQMMRSDKLGYEAPIIVVDRKYYSYEDPAYSIKQGALSSLDLQQLGEAVAVLKQFQGFGYLEELGGLVQKLEDKVTTSSSPHQRPSILLDANERLKGLEFLEELYQAVRQEKVVRLAYQSFKAAAPSLIEVHPLLLREYNNRWFLIACRNQQRHILSFALDRIQSVTFPQLAFQPHPDFDPQTYYKHVLGVTVNNQRANDVRIWLHPQHAPYVLTKPLHHSQVTEAVHEDGSAVVRIHVIPNFELERVLLGFGPGLKVLAPRRLRRRIAELHRAAWEGYEE